MRDQMMTYVNTAKMKNLLQNPRNQVYAAMHLDECMAILALQDQGAPTDPEVTQILQKHAKGFHDEADCDSPCSAPPMPIETSEWGSSKPAFLQVGW